jgi:hypothetical protein
MKRLLTLALLTLTILTVACSTATMSAPKGAADLSGMVSSVDGNTLTITPTGGQPTTVTLNADTAISWPGGAPALVNEISKGHMVNVWLVSGSQTATRVNIGY